MNESIKPDVPYLLPAGEGPGHHTLPPATAGPGLLARSRSKQSKQSTSVQRLNPTSQPTSQCVYIY